MTSLIVSVCIKKARAVAVILRRLQQCPTRPVPPPTRHIRQAVLQVPTPALL